MSDRHGLNSLGDTIARARKTGGLTQVQLAEEMGVSQPTIANWESGETTPSDDQVRRLQDWLDEAIDRDEAPECGCCGTEYVPLAMRRISVDVGDEVYKAILCYWCSKTVTIQDVVELAR